MYKRKKVHKKTTIKGVGSLGRQLEWLWSSLSAARLPAREREARGIFCRGELVLLLFSRNGATVVDGGVDSESGGYLLR